MMRAVCDAVWNGSNIEISDYVEVDEKKTRPDDEA
jgi:hypothetical protein